MIDKEKVGEINDREAEKDKDYYANSDEHLIS